MKKILCFAVMGAALSCALPAFAQSEEFAQLTPPGAAGKDVNFSLGAALLSLPRYTGSDQRRLAEYPLFDAQWKNGAFVSLVSGLGYNLSKDPTIQYGLRVTVEPSRDESRSGRLHGLGDVDAALEPGVFFNYIPSANYALVSSLRYGSGVDRNGLQLSLGGRYTTALNNKHRLSATLDASWANSNYQQSYFGVTAAQAASSGYAQFTPSSGITDIRLGANWNWSIDSKWSLITGASVKHLVGDSARSPFVDQKNPVSVFSAASYSF